MKSQSPPHTITDCPTEPELRKTSNGILSYRSDKDRMEARRVLVLFTEDFAEGRIELKFRLGNEKYKTQRIIAAIACAVHVLKPKPEEEKEDAQPTTRTD